MDLCCNLQLPGLEAALAAFLPQGVTPQRLKLDEHGLELEVHAPHAGSITLTADTDASAAGLRLSRFKVHGAGLMNGMIENQLRKKVAELDLRNRALRLCGDSEGQSVHLSWQA